MLIWIGGTVTFGLFATLEHRTAYTIYRIGTPQILSQLRRRSRRRRIDRDLLDLEQACDSAR